MKAAARPPREARLKQSAAELYPTIPVETWIQAATAADMVWALRLQRGEGSECLSSRILSADHFEFRHGEPPSPGPHRRRARDGSGWTLQGG